MSVRMGQKNKVAWAKEHGGAIVLRHRQFAGTQMQKRRWPWRKNHFSGTAQLAVENLISAQAD
jgi:hypothetical protein